MSAKTKGINAERELIHLFYSKGWMSCRVAGSGSSRYPSPDIIAGNRLRKLAIECKVTKDKKKYLNKYDIEQLKEFCNVFGAEPWFAVKFGSSNLLFLSMEDIEKTENGYVIDSKVSERRGLLLEELIK